MEAAALPAEPVQRIPAARPRFVWFAVASFACFAVLVTTNDWLPAICFLMPAFVIGCRYLELARFGNVHRSRWLIVLIVWCLVMAMPMAVEFRDPARGVEYHWPVILSAALLAMVGGHLFVVQRSLVAERIARGAQNGDQPCADWVFGGLLAALPPYFLVGFGDVLAGRDPWEWLELILGVVLFVLQLQRNRLFPWLTIVCLVVWTAGNARESLSAHGDAPAWVVTWNLVVLCAPILVLAVYLWRSKRVRRTFAATAG